MHCEKKLVGSGSKVAAQATQGPNPFTIATQCLQKRDVMRRETIVGDEASTERVSVVKKRLMDPSTRITSTKVGKSFIPNDFVLLLIGSVTVGEVQLKEWVTRN